MTRTFPSYWHNVLLRWEYELDFPEWCGSLRLVTMKSVPNGTYIRKNKYSDRLLNITLTCLTMSLNRMSYICNLYTLSETYLELLYYETIKREVIMSVGKEENNCWEQLVDLSTTFFLAESDTRLITLPTPTLLTITSTQVLWFLECLTWTVGVSYYVTTRTRLTVCLPV